MIIGCEAQMLSDYICSQFRERIALQSYTGQALSDCCSLLTELTLDLQLAPIALVGTGQLPDWRHLVQCCRPALERARLAIVLSNEALPKPLENCAELKLANDDVLLKEWFTIVYSPELTYLVLAQANANGDLTQNSVIISFDREIVGAALHWLVQRNNSELMSSLARELAKVEQEAQSLPSQRRESFLARALEKVASTLNRAPIEHDRIAQEMEAALYKLALSNSELAVLNTMLELISRSLDTREIYQRLLRAVEVVDIEAALILLLDEEGTLNIDFHGGLSVERAQAIKDAFNHRLAAANGSLPDELQIYYPEEFDETYAHLRQVAAEAHIRTIVCIPLRSRNSVIGLMVLPTSSHRNFSTEDQRLLSSIGSQVGIAIESANLYEKSQRLARQMGALFEVGKTISSHLEIKPLLASIAENAGKLLDAEHTLVSVVFSDQKSNSMNTMAEWSLDNNTRTIDLAEMVKDREPTEEVTQENNDASLICFPIYVTDRSSGQRRLLGTFCASRGSKQKRPFNSADLDLLNNLTSQVSIAVENAELYTKIVAANEQLREAIRLKDELVSMVAHDFRSPLTSIQAFSELLQERVEDKDIKKYLAIINRQSKHLASLAADTLTMSRLETGNLPLDFKPFKIDELLGSLVEARTAEANVDINLEARGEEIEISGDYRRLYEVIDNLIGNAIKYSPDGAVVRVKLERIDDGVQVSVSDKGMGIAPYDMSRLFQKFSRLDAARQRQIAGTGLGLYICRSIIEAHGGRIWVDSEVGKGSTFHFILPFQHPSQENSADEKTS